MLYLRLFECWNLHRLVWSFIGGEKVSGCMQQVTSACEPMAPRGHTIPMRNVPSSAEASAMVKSDSPGSRSRLLDDECDIRRLRLGR